jgi:hypothetical protein
MTLGTASLTAVVDGTHTHVTVTATCTGLTSATFYRITPEGETILRGGLNDPGTSPLVLIDYDCPQNTVLSYRAIVTDGVSSKVAGPSAMTGGVIDHGGDALYPIADPTSMLVLNVVGLPELRRPTRQDVVTVVGRADPIVVSDVRQYPAGVLTVVTLDAAERLAVIDLLADGALIAFKPWNPDYGFEDTWFLAVAGVTERRVSKLGIVPERYVDMEVQRVAAPPGSPVV